MDKIKFIYIGNDIKDIKSGGDAVNKQNIKLLYEIMGNSFMLKKVEHDGKFFTFINMLFNYLCGLSFLKSISIVRYLKDQKASIIFLPSSKMGKLCKKIKKNIPNSKIIIFFHNIEKQYSEEEFKVNRSLKNLFIRNRIRINEFYSIKYGDYFITLNKRDSSLMNTFYNKEPNLVLPLALPDKFNVVVRERIKKEIKDRKLNLLFVGSAFFANIEALNWFLKNVFNYLNNCRLTIVGNNMDKHFSKSENVEVYGYVDDLSYFYYKSDLVIAPIFSGGGMKTKTAEALMYGMPIIGTNESFEGYDIDYNKIGGCFNDADGMINMINKIESKRKMISYFSENSRRLYLEKYSEEINKRKLARFLEEI